MSEGGAAVAIRNLGLKALRRLGAAHKPFVRLARRRARAAERRDALREVAGLERDLRRVALGRGAVIVGPWLAEVGYEALYWVPFVRWFQDACRVSRDRIVVVSRGGVRDWYDDLAAAYVDIFDVMTPEDLAEANERRRDEVEAGGRKQTSTAALDEELLRRARSVVGLRDAAVLHPSLLFRLFRHVWHGTLPFDYLWTHTRFARLTPTMAVPAGLPAEFTAVKFYSGTALPPEPWVRDALRALVERAARVRPVIVLDSGITVDEHEDYTFAGIPNVYSAAQWMSPATNLGLQSALIAKAALFLTTCGGLAWIAPFLGTDTVAAYASDRQLAPHLYVARHAIHRARGADLVPVDLRVARHLSV